MICYNQEGMNMRTCIDRLIAQPRLGGQLVRQESEFIANRLDILRHDGTISNDGYAMNVHLPSPVIYETEMGHVVGIANRVSFQAGVVSTDLNHWSNKHIQEEFYTYQNISLGLDIGNDSFVGVIPQRIGTNESSSLLGGSYQADALLYNFG